jgi:tetratricopeptide (TPR) repeat protein
MAAQQTRLWFSYFFAAACLLASVGGTGWAQTGAEPAYLRGITALHQFEYEDANEAFLQARRIDPSFVMAYWGEAMTYNQTLWRNEDVAAGRQVLAGLGVTSASRRARATSARDQGFLAAVEALFADGDAETRHRRYADEMARLYERFPDDADVASFYALALLGTMSRGLIGHLDAHEGHSQTLAGSDTQSRVSQILGRVLRAHPEHMGALHYLLHNDDDPGHAHLALAAARTLAQLAPDSSHARHMPSHVFLQLGLWHDAVDSDRAAFAASEAWVQRKQLNPALRSYHALAWLQYELLQLGRRQEAWATLDQIAPIVATSQSLTLLSDLSTMRARYVIESADWRRLSNQSTFGNVNELFAIGISAARTGHAALAERARQGLAERSQDPREGDLRPAAAIMEREVAAMLALDLGRGVEAVGILQAAAQSEAQLPPPLGLPEPIKPAPELLGEVLLELGRGPEAVEPFELALQRNPNRSLSVLGLARASAAAQRAEAAKGHYAAWLANMDRADADLPALGEARSAVATRRAPDSSTLLNPRALIVTSVVVLFALGLIWRARKRGPVARAPRTSSIKRNGRNRRDRKDR